MKGVFPHEFPPEEGKFVSRCLEDPSNWRRLFLWADSDLAREGVARVLGHASFNSLRMAMGLVKFLFARIAEANFAEIPGLVLALQTVMKIGDDSDGEKLSCFVQLFRDAMTRGLKESYIAYNYMADLFLELAYDSSQFDQKIYEDADRMNFVRKWLEYNSYPAAGYVSPHAASRRSTGSARQREGSRSGPRLVPMVNLSYRHGG
ncbi:MAG: hypothetical protein P4M11_06830 [Candidatus Pacebacteria bacterium]|nr:hypothetical protein [Candidatus Paceibacterota bacterium]